MYEFDYNYECEYLYDEEYVRQMKLRDQEFEQMYYDEVVCSQKEPEE